MMCTRISFTIFLTLVVAPAVTGSSLRCQIGPFIESERSVIPITNTGDWRFRFTLADMNGDGLLDVVAGVNTWAPLLQKMTGRWESVPVDMSVRPPGARDNFLSNSVPIGDIDGDGHLDMLIAQTVPSPSYPHCVLLGDGTGQMRAVYGRGIDTFTGEYARGSILFDADGDGDLDALIWHIDSFQDRLFLNDGRGFFTEVTGTHLPTLDLWTTCVAHADLDQDGDQDLVVCQSGGPTLVLHNDGTGRFQVAQTLHEIQLAEHVSLGDFDLDGYPDAYVGTFNPQRDYLLKNDGTGRFVDAILGMPNATGITRTVCTAFGDLDGDGLPEIVIAGGIQSGGGVYSPVVWRNLGNMRFEDVTTQVHLDRAPPDRGAITTVDIADMDGDGDLDIVILYFGNAPPPRNLGRVLFNVTRHLDAPVIGVRGHDLDVKHYARSGNYVFPFVTGRILPAPIALPNLGLLGIDPSGMVSLPVRQVAPGQHFATLTIPVPNDMGLFGGLLWFQGIDTNGTDFHLTNWLRVQIL